MSLTKFTIAVLGMSMMLGFAAFAQEPATPAKVAPRPMRTKTPRVMKHATTKKTVPGSHEPAVR